MKIPAKPPALEPTDISEILEVLFGEDGETVRAALLESERTEYLHWEKFRYREPPKGFSPERWWHAAKIGRQGSRRLVKGLRDPEGHPHHYCLVDPIPERLHKIDRDAAGRIEVPDEIVNPMTRDRYIFRSLVEEALRSSQIEGAVTTRKAAKEMIREGRHPRNTSERMVLNNYLTMEYIREIRNQELTPELVFELHRMMTEGTLTDPSDAGRFRRNEDRVRVEDHEGNIIYVPPTAEELPARLETMCEFANGKGERAFLAPVLRAVILHYWLASEHPFVDGNGRCARALFYWSMLREGYWLCEFLSISQAVHRSRQAYYRSFLYTQTDDNDLTYFILYHLGVILDAIGGLYRDLKKKARELRETELSVREAGSLNHRQRALLHHALRHSDQLYTVESHRRSHGVVRQTARSDLNDLERKRLLHRSRRGKAFVFSVAPDLRRRIDTAAAASVTETSTD